MASRGTVFSTGRAACWVLLLGALLLSAAACSNAEFRRAAKQTFPAGATDSGFTVTFLGTSSFLLETAQEQVLIDGYVSRPWHYLFRWIEPNPEQIHRWIDLLGICKSPDAGNTEGQPEACSSPGKPGLALVLTMHGHYDHAMDASYFAAWAGAPIVRDSSLDVQWEATRKLLSDNGADFQRQPDRRVDLKAYLGNPPKPLPVSTIGLKLYETRHNENPISRRIKPETPATFEFPASIWDMGEGTSVSVLAEAPNGKKILFAGSAGDPGAVFSSNGVKADVVFLSIGGLGSQDREERAAYWANTVKAAGAKRVFLIHWDNHQKKLPEPGEPLVPTFFEPNSKVLAHLRELASGPEGNVEILFPPAGERFDPFR